jgi:hypothetical protein
MTTQSVIPGERSEASAKEGEGKGTQVVDGFTTL